MLPILVLFLLISTKVSNGAKLLLNTMDQGRSHATSFTPLMHRLQKDNHTVALQFTSFEKDIDFGMEERFINMTGFKNNFLSDDFAVIAWHGEFSFIHQAVPFIFGSISCKSVLEHRRQRFDQIASEDWDLFLSDSLFTVCGYGMAAQKKRPHVIMHSSDVESAHGAFKGMSRNYVTLVPNFLPYSLPDFTVEKFSHRITATVDWFGSMFTTGVVASTAMKWALSSIIPFPFFSFYDYVRLSSFSFTDMPEALYPPGAKTNDVFSYGAYCKPSKDLKGELVDFVEDKASKGTIIIAFGTIIDWRQAPEDKIDMFVEALNKFPEYRIIWSTKAKRPEGLLPHVKTTTWIPQNELLHHNKTVLFMSHGGLKSVKEAACSATPSIFMPMFAEQMRNAWLAKNKGVARIINKFLLTSEYLEDNIRQILNDHEYQAHADHLSSFILDLPMPSLDHAAFHFRKLIQYNGKLPSFFYPKSIQMSYLTSLNLDFLIVIPVLFLYVVSR